MKYYVSGLDNINNNLLKISSAHSCNFGADNNMQEEMLAFQLIGGTRRNLSDP
jgi:hypothetical protein